ncbi:MAG TPA: hypothetical protein ENH62_10725 [Marinobacter sp.]|uniref:Uncharacterized protein n=1 Tax=marine sediment metagenome TaxID=412755 RepID=A0A0F9N4T3_9ZZZZ|nr:hypothetical protein [Marinobacter sp.]
MIYTANITTPKDTSLTALKRTRLHVTKGLVYKVEFYFPAGSAGLMGVAVFDGLYQVWPSTVGVFFTGQDQMITFDDLYLKEAQPFEFQCYTYNLDDTYEHLVSVRIGLVSKEVFQARYLPSKSAEVFKQVLAQMEAERQELARWQRARLPATPFAWMLKLEGDT